MYLVRSSDTVKERHQEIERALSFPRGHDGSWSDDRLYCSFQRHRPSRSQSEFDNDAKQTTLKRIKTERVYNQR